MLKKTFIFIFVVSAIFFSCSCVHASSIVLGPKKYMRIKGAPEAAKETFSVCAASGAYRLVVENGAYLATDDNDKKKEKKTKISAGEIKIDGDKIIKEDDLKKKVGRFEKTVTLSAGNHVMQVEVEGKPGAFITVALECVSGCVEARINSPSTGTTINNTKALVRGYILNSNGEVGVALSSSATGIGGSEVSALGQVNGVGFAGSVPLASGANTITATATDACGLRAEDTITVEAVAGAYVEVSASPGSGVPPPTGAFSTTLRADARVNAAIAGYSWDTDGDGATDASGKDISNTAASYTQPGLYFPKVTVTDAAGNQYSDTTVVNVVSLADVDALLKGKWDGMRGGLAAGNVDMAVGYFLTQSQGHYRGIFTVLISDLPQIAATMNTTEFIYLRSGVAKYRIKRAEPAGDITYYIYFGQDENGIWKIKQF